MKEQASLGGRRLHKTPIYNQTQIGRVTNTKDYAKYGRIEVILLDYSQPFPVWVNGDVDRAPAEGDQVLIGFIQGRPDSPYLAGFIHNESYTSNFIKIDKDRILLQFPTQLDDIKGHLMDDNMKASRITIELSASGVHINGNIQCTGDIQCTGSIHGSTL